ncbi:MAG: hypothetical protein M1818_005648 [Claussenomyces sp. TS43310]|nr:MAG: hypothetical protein M1818_005648 [Claussenomyces sp. TS43310]
MADFVDSIAIESWVLYTVALLLVFCRLTSKRLVTQSWRKFQSDDYIMMLVVVTFTGTIVSANECARNLSNWLPLDVAESLSPADARSAIYGSKMTMVLEEFTLTTSWLVKACFLIMYSRLTLGLGQHIIVKIVGAYCVVGYVVTQVLYLGVWCRPIEQYWALPAYNVQCSSYYHHMITATTFNISSDVMMLFIPVPLLLGSKLPLKRKLLLSGVFSLGIFVVLCAVLNRYYNFTHEYNPIFLSWYVAETATAVMVANIPLCWPLVRYLFNMGSFISSSRGGGGNSGNSANMSHHKPIYMRNKRMPGAERLPNMDFGMSESEERIAGTYWKPEDQLELRPVGDSGKGWTSKVGAGNTGMSAVHNHHEPVRPCTDADENIILKTVEVEQRFS